MGVGVGGDGVGWGGRRHIVPPHVHVLKYLKNALSYRLETLWKRKLTDFQYRNYFAKHSLTPALGLIGASLKRAPQLRVDLAFCHDIYIYIYRPADLCLWSGARRQGRMLRAKSSRRNFVWERSSVLVHACSFTFVFEFVTDRTCQSLAFAFDCQHGTTGQKNTRTSEKCHQVKEAGTFFCLRASRQRNMIFVFRFTCPSRKPIRQNNAFFATHCRHSKLLPQLIDYSATKGFFLTDNWVTLVFHNPARC